MSCSESKLIFASNNNGFTGGLLFTLCVCMCACVYVRVCVVGISDMYRLRITQTCSLNFQASNMKLSVFLYSDYAGHYTPLHKNNRLFLTSIMLPVGVSVKIFNCQPMSFGMEILLSIKQSSNMQFSGQFPLLTDK